MKSCDQSSTDAVAPAEATLVAHGPEPKAKEGGMEHVLASVLDHINRWERENLPGAETPQGQEVLVWLLKSASNPRPLKDLYRSSRYSEPTIRTYLKQFIERGFVEIRISDDDLRTRYAYPTQRLGEAVDSYWQHMRDQVLAAMPGGPEVAPGGDSAPLAR